MKYNLKPEVLRAMKEYELHVNRNISMREQQSAIHLNSCKGFIDLLIIAGVIVLMLLLG